MSKIDDKKVKALIHRLGLKYKLSDDKIKEIVESQFLFTYDTMKEIDFDKIETEEDLEKTFKLIEEINPLILYIHYFVPYPGSEAYNIYRDKISVRNISHYTYSGINLTEVDTEKLKSFMKYFYKRYYLSWRYIKEYIKQRLKYAVFDIDEWMLVKNALKFIISK